MIPSDEGYLVDKGKLEQSIKDPLAKNMNEFINDYLAANSKVPETKDIPLHGEMIEK